MTQLIIMNPASPVTGGVPKTIYFANLVEEEAEEVKQQDLPVLLCNGWLPIDNTIHLLPAGGVAGPGGMNVVPLPFVTLVREVEDPKPRPTLQLPDGVV